MKFVSSLTVVTTILALASGANAFTREETNSVAMAILEYAAEDLECEVEENVSYPVRYTDWNGLLDGVDIQGWTREDKSAALTDFILHQSTNDFLTMSCDLCELIRIGLCDIRDLNYTNALPIIRNLVINPSSPMRNDAEYVYFNWVELNTESIATTEILLGDNTWATSDDRRDAIVGIASAINRYRTSIGSDLVYTNAIRSVYSVRHTNASSGNYLDQLFTEAIPGYSLSSNRLETALGWLNTTNLDSVARSRCEAITNELLNTEVALAQIPVLQGL